MFLSLTPRSNRLSPSLTNRPRRKLYMGNERELLWSGKSTNSSQLHSWPPTCTVFLRSYVTYSYTHTVAGKAEEARPNGLCFPNGTRLMMCSRPDWFWRCCFCCLAWLSSFWWRIKLAIPLNKEHANMGEKCASQLMMGCIGANRSQWFNLLIRNAEGKTRLCNANVFYVSGVIIDPIFIFCGRSLILDQN